MQQVRLPSEDQCQRGGAQPAGVLCASEYYTRATAGSEDLEAVRALWGNRSGVPWRFRPAQESGAAPRAGVFQAFDASGYALDYDLQGAQSELVATHRAFREDMRLLRAAGWIGTRTRAVHVSFGSYNGNFDFWLYARFLLEMPASGFVNPRIQVTVYRPSLVDTPSWEPQLIIDTVRLAFVLYICTWHLYRELRHEVSKRKELPLYRLLGWRDLVDLSLGAVFAYIFIVRYLVLGALMDTTAVLAQRLGASFDTQQDVADRFYDHTVAEAVFLFLVVLRLATCCRVNRHFFVIWTTMRLSMKRYKSFVLMFWPLLLGFAVLGHAIWRSDQLGFKSFSSSLASTVMMLSRDNSAVNISASNFQTVLFFMFFNFVMVVLFTNSWIAVMVQAYQTTRVTSGYHPSDYAWDADRWARWCLWSPLLRIWRWLRPRSRHSEEDE